MERITVGITQMKNLVRKYIKDVTKLENNSGVSRC